jgi:hypothetical protein
MLKQFNSLFIYLPVYNNTDKSINNYTIYCIYLYQE